MLQNLRLPTLVSYQPLQEERKRVDIETAAAMKQIAIEREDARQRLADEREKIEREKDVWKNHLMMVRYGINDAGTLFLITFRTGVVWQEKEKLMQEYALFDEERKKIVDACIGMGLTGDIRWCLVIPPPSACPFVCGRFSR